MAVKVPTPDNSFDQIEVSLAGKTYNLVYRFNERWKKDENDQGTWVIDLLNSSEEVIIRGLAVIESGQLLIDNLILPEFSHGNFFIAKFQSTDLLPTFDNFGLGKEYELIYVPNEELEELGLA